MKAEQLREMTDDQLDSELLVLRREQFNLRMQAGTGQLAGANELRAARHNVARIKTIVRERELQKNSQGQTA